MRKQAGNDTEENGEETPRGAGQNPEVVLCAEVRSGAESGRANGTHNEAEGKGAYRPRCVRVIQG